MARRTPLTPDQLTAALAGLPEWSGDTSGIERTVQGIDFADAAEVMADLALAAGELDHHPDVDVRWRTLRIAVTTHSAGGVTELDVEYARRADEALAPFTDTDPELAAQVDTLLAPDRQPGSGA
ncbi:4a-hydroxytetrahydrobiopterin dehydratase [Modestobacter roseus]|uniref:Putative pterin-4-alpha-carbinolamine dehydratase n=1 Tax=Modestobacter roseus TaxID=1181884 RepID=A0A562ILD0_9ACTN|nr:4a-hydroxytetrahydrobiopterin dehydratase [Modestobacter roseus]MQA32187.1 4a-hydroxytetrahydrobiopterin dehydratase [Modestobacter roseus]TWH71682.1 4a-hydroxytetrahydrobiopterin dehydratase [Modestobacter roseus]